MTGDHSAPSTSARRRRDHTLGTSRTIATAPLTSRTLPGICGTVPVRRPYVSQVEHASTVRLHATGETPDSAGCRTVRTICGTTIATPRVAPR